MAIALGGTVTANANLGNQAALSLAGITTGALMILECYENNGTAPPAVPAGWTDRGSYTGANGGSARLVSKIKGAETTVSIGGGSLGLCDAVLAWYTGAVWGEVTQVSGNTTSTTVDPGAVTIDNSDSWSLIAVGGAVTGATFTYPAGWTQEAGSSINSSLAIAAKNSGISSGSLDPGNVTYSSTSLDRIVWHIELTASVTAVTLTLAASNGAGTGSNVTLVQQQVLQLAASAGVASDSLTMTAKNTLQLVASAGVSTNTGQLEVGLNPRWKAAFRRFKNGTGKATAIVLGDSVAEGFEAGPNARTADMFTTRAGLNLARIGGLTFASRYMPGLVVDGSQINNFTSFGHWPESSGDPWTRAGSVAGGTNDRGLGLRSPKLTTSAAYMEIAAPADANFATVQFSTTTIAVPVQISSNGVVVYSGTFADLSEHSVIVPLQGSGNLLRITCVDATLGYLFVHGVVWQKDAHPAGQIIPAETITANANAGGTATASLAGITNGTFMVALLAQNNGPSTPPATPSGWDSRGTWDGGGCHYRVCTRVKQNGDAAVSFSAGGFGAAGIAIAAYKNATWGSISADVHNTAAGSTIDPASLPVTLGDASLLVVGEGNGTAGAPFTFPTGWSQNVSQANGMCLGIASKTTGLVDQSLDPGIITYSDTSSPDRVVWHIDLVRTNNDRSTLVYVEVIEAGHGGMQAHNYANPETPPATGTYSGDFDGRQWDDFNALNPEMVVIELGGNDINNGKTAADFQASLGTIVANIDAKVSPPPDILIVTYPYIDGTNAGLTPWGRANWALFEAAAAAAAVTLGVRARHLKLSSYIHDLDGSASDDFTSSIDHFHPSPYGQRTIGDLVAGALADSITPLTLAASAGQASTSSVMSVAQILQLAASQGVGGMSGSIYNYVLMTLAAAAGVANGSVNLTILKMLLLAQADGVGATSLNLLTGTVFPGDLNYKYMTLTDVG